jgi:DNA-binding transcriptional regulator YhcF (GntR family)
MIYFDPTSSKPKYQQLIDGIIDGINSGLLEHGKQLPSINKVASEFNMARMTVTKAYDDLREKGLISSHHGKGFYVSSTNTKNALRVFILMDALTPYKEILYDSIIQHLGEDVSHNLFFHYHDIELFEELITNNLGKYNHYIILPHFNKSVARIVSKIPKDKLLVLDINVKEFSDDYSILYQNFESNIYQGLTACLEKVKKYQQLNLLLSSKSFQYTPDGIIQGFTQFCTENNLEFDIIPDLDDDYELQVDQAYIVFREYDLIKMINWTTKHKLKVGKDIGIISYDDTPLKEIIAEGISVISNDFKKMGERAAEIIINREKGRESNEFYFIDRGSL